MTVAKTLRAILLGSPVDPEHQPDAFELYQKLAEIETQAALNGALYFEDTLADLNAVAAPAAGDTGFVLDDGANEGIYLRGASTWAKTAELPDFLTDAVAAVAAVAVEEARALAAEAALDVRVDALEAAGNVSTADIAANAVTNAKMATMAEATIKGRQAGAGTGDPQDMTASQARTTLGLGTAATTDATAYATAAQGATADTAVQPGDDVSDLAETATAKIMTGDERTKLAGVEAGADVTDTANVTAAGALMDSEVTSLSGVKSLVVPDATTISAFAKTVLDDTSAADVRTTLGLGTAAVTDAAAYATAAQGVLAGTAIQAAGLAAAVAAEATIRDAADVVDVWRPGENRALFSAETTGEPTARAVLTLGSVVASDAGAVLRLTGADSDPTDGYAVVAPRAAFALEPDRVYEVRAIVRRAVDPADPSGHGVELRARNLSASKAHVSNVALAASISLTVAMGRTEIAAYVCRGTPPAGVTVYSPPSTARYITPHLRVYGNGAETDIEVIDWQDVTDVVTAQAAADAAAAVAATALQPGDAVSDLAETATAKIMTGDERTKLAGIEAGADVTDTANVTAAGAVMDSEVASLTGIKTLTVLDNTTISAFGKTLVDDADAAAARATLGLVIGTDVQAYDPDLAAIAGLTSAADRVPYFSGSGMAALATFTAAGRALLDDADAAAQRTTLGLGTAATTAATAYATAAQGATADSAVQPAALAAEVAARAAADTALDAATDAVVAGLASHESDISNPHSVTKAQVGLGNVDNTSDANKPISTATQTALDGKSDVTALAAETAARVSQIGTVRFTDCEDAPFDGSVVNEAGDILSGYDADGAMRVAVLRADAVDTGAATTRDINIAVEDGEMIEAVTDEAANLWAGYRRRPDGSIVTMANELELPGQMTVLIDTMDSIPPWHSATVTPDGAVLSGIRTPGGPLEVADREALVAPRLLYVEAGEDATTDLIVTWHSFAGSAVLEFRAVGASTWMSAGGFQRTWEDLIETVFTVRLRGLTPDTLYEVRPVGSGSLGLRRIRTLPDDGRDLVVVHTTDTQVNSQLALADSTWNILNDFIAADEPDLIIMGGDFLANSGVVSTSNANYWRSFLSGITQRFVRADGSLVPLIAVRGNHEVQEANYYSGDGDDAYLGRWFSGLYRTQWANVGGDGYGYVTVGRDLLIIVVESNHATPIAPQVDWLDELLTSLPASAFRHVLFVSHVNPFPSRNDVWDEAFSYSQQPAPRIIRREMLPLLQGHSGFRFAMCGHSHFLMASRRVLIETVETDANNWYADAAGFRVLGAGGWGAPAATDVDAEDRISAVDGSTPFEFALSTNGVEIGVTPISPVTNSNTDPATLHYWRLTFRTAEVQAEAINLNGGTYIDITETIGV